MAASAASAFDPSGPPACAISGRPPPPLPPSASAPLRTKSTALKRADEIVGDADDDAGFAILGNTDNSDNPGADLLLAFVGEAAEILQVDALDRAGHEFDVADDADAVGAVGLSSTAHGELLLRLRQFAFDTLALVEQGGDTVR